MYTLTLFSLISMSSPDFEVVEDSSWIPSGANPSSWTRTIVRVVETGPNPAKQRFAILREPLFRGHGPLIVAGASSLAVLGSGIALSFLYPRHITRCWQRDGAYRCRTTEIFHPEWFGWLSGTVFVGAHLSTALGITGGILRARYDAWRIHKGLAVSLRPEPYIWAGTVLTVTSVTMLVGTLVALDPWIDHPSKFMIPMMFTTAVLAGSGGLTMLSYGVKLRKYGAILETLSAAPFGSVQSRTAGLSFAGQF